MSYTTDFNIFVGCTLGIFRGINFHRKDNNWETLTKNIQNMKSLDENCGITELVWSDADEIDILIGLKDQCVKIYDTDYKAFTNSVSVKFGSGMICGLSKYNGLLLTAVESGDIRLWRFKTEEGDFLNVGDEITKMRHNLLNKNIIAVGGKGKMDLKLWDLEVKKYIFTAKNVRPNELQLQVPIWISDIAFLRNRDAFAVCTRHGQVRLYDPNVQRRPVVNIEIPEETLTTMSLTGRDDCVMVGSGRGTMKLIDLRKTESVVKTYRGSVGSIRSIACTPIEPFVVSVGLDRFIKVHNLHTAELLYKGFLKTKLNCVLVRSQFTPPKEEEPGGNHNESVIEGPLEDGDVQLISECDKIFDGMETIEEPVKKRKKIS